MTFDEWLITQTTYNPEAGEIISEFEQAWDDSRKNILEDLRDRMDALDNQGKPHSAILGYLEGYILNELEIIYLIDTPPEQG